MATVLLPDVLRCTDTACGENTSTSRFTSVSVTRLIRPLGTGSSEAAVAVELGDLQLILHLDVEGAAGLRHQLLRAAGTAGRRFKLQRLSDN